MQKLFCFLLILVCILFLSCSHNKEFAKVYWQGELIQNERDINYLYWRDGNQYFRQEKDSVVIEMTGFSVNRMVFVLISLTNDKNQIFTFYPGLCKLFYNFENNLVELIPSRPKNLDKNQLSLFNSIISGAGAITRLFINVPVDRLLSQDKKSALATIDSEYNESDIKITKKIFIGTHTLLPQTNYSGLLVFEYEKQLELINQPFTIEIDTENNIFTATGELRL